MIRRVLATWLPLYASWLLMTAEGPVLSAVVNRLPDEVVMLAALGVAFAVAVTIESPIINLLSTSTALVRDRPSYLVVRRFTLHWMAVIGIVGVLVGFGPLFEPVVLGVLATPPEVARWVRPGLQILAIWPAAIGWRRFLQGILIRFGRARAVARGTAWRLAATVGTGLGLAWLRPLAAAEGVAIEGIHIAAWALLVGVLVESAYATWAARPVIAQLSETPRRPLDYRGLFAFHLPLAMTAVLTLAAQPLVTFTLARLDRPEVNLAAWPLVFQGLLLLRAASLALPEVVIALSDEDESDGNAESGTGAESAEAALRRFALTLSAIFLVLMGVLVSTPLLDLYLVGLQDADPAVAALAALGLGLCLPLPAGAILVSWLQGRLIAAGRTRAVNASTFLQLVVLAAGLAVGLAIGTQGMATAVVSLQVSIFAQGLYMAWRLRAR